MVAEIELYRKKSVNVRRNSGASVSFMIQPSMLGHIDIKVTASGDSQTDTVEKKLFVKVMQNYIFFSCF